MLGPTRPTFTTLNDLTQKYQDEVYTLAYYLLGNEPAAVKITQEAFIQVHRPDMIKEHFRLEALKYILLDCKGKRPRHSASADAMCDKLLKLEEDEQAAVVLVDVLGLTYDEAAWVMGRNPKQVTKLVSQARIHLAA